MSSEIEYLNRLPTGWFALGVLQKDGRVGSRAHWAAHIVNTHPDELEALVREGRPWGPEVRSGWLSVPGRHKTAEDAWEALQDMIATRH